MDCVKNKGKFQYLCYIFVILHSTAEGEKLQLPKEIRMISHRLAAAMPYLAKCCGKIGCTL